MKQTPQQTKTRIERLLERMEAVPCPAEGCICDLLNEAVDLIRAMDAAGHQLGQENNVLRETIGITRAAVELMMDDCDDRPAN